MADGVGVTLGEALSAVEARVGPIPRERADNPSLRMRRMTGRTIGLGPTGRPSGRPGYLAHRPVDVERAVLWPRLIALAGPSTPDVNRLRRRAQDCIPPEHEPGWICIGSGEAWFSYEPPVGAVLSGRGVMAVRVHDDCACGEAS